MISIPFLRSKKQPKNDIYIGIFFKEQEGAVMYLEDSGAGLKILGTEQFTYSNAWEQLVDDVDEALYRLETKFHLTPQKTIFFIYSHFVDPEQKDIRRPFLSKIKEISKSLDLKPLGYIECQEAIIEHLRSREHAPLHMILLEFDKTVVTLSLYQGGNNIHQETVARSGNVINTLNPIFHQLKEKFVLPNRLILYDEKSLTNDVSALLSNRWDEAIFPTPPKVDILTQEELQKSLVDVFARQIHAAPTPAGSAAPIPPMPVITEPFVANSTDSQENGMDDTAQAMGFVIGDEVSEEPKSPKSPKGSFFKGFSMPKVRFPSSGNTIPMIGIGILVLILLVLGGGEYLLHKTQVKVLFPSKQVTKNVQVASDMKLEEGSDSREVNGTTPVTGTKQTGEKAKGSVTLYNSSLQDSRTLSKGTKLIGPNNLAFILDSDVKIASASGDASAINSSTAKAATVAGDIGPEYNISSGSKLTVQGESATSLIAKADSSFSGGTKRQIKVASKDDIAKLRTQLVEEAKKNAASNLKSKVGSGKVIVDDLTTVTLENEKYSKKAGDEADSVSLTASAKTTYYMYDESKLMALFNKELSNGLASGTRIQSDTIQYHIAKLDPKDNPATRKISFDVNAKAVPVFDLAKMTAEMSGKQVSSLDKIVREQYHADRAEVMNTPGIPPFSMFTPFVKKNLTVTVEYQ